MLRHHTSLSCFRKNITEQFPHKNKRQEQQTMKHNANINQQSRSNRNKQHDEAKTKEHLDISLRQHLRSSHCRSTQGGQASPAANPPPWDHRPEVEASMSVNKSSLEDVGPLLRPHTDKLSLRRDALVVKRWDGMLASHPPGQTPRRKLYRAEPYNGRRVRVKEGER